jgi:hypothetical protein
MRNTCKTVVSTVLALSITAVLYFRNYHAPLNHPSLFSCLTHPMQTALFGLTMIGALFERPSASAVLGVLEVLLFVVLTRLGSHRRLPSVYIMLLYLFMTAGAAAVARSGFGIAQAMEARYGIVSVLVLVCTVTLLIEALPRVFQRPSLVVAVWALTFAGYYWSVSNSRTELQNARDYLVQGAMRWGNEKRDDLCYPRPAMDHASRILDESIKQGVYRLPNLIRAP